MNTIKTLIYIYIYILCTIKYSVNHKNNYKTNYKYILESFQVYPLARKYPSPNDSKNEPFNDKLNN